MPRYEHTQTRLLVELVILAIAGIVSLLAIIGGEMSALFTLIMVIFVTALVHALTKLTVTVSDEAVTAAFRWGRPARTVPLTDIVSVERVRNRWWYGLGIRVIPNATTLYNVWGLDAVHLELPGPRNFRIGTDDPDGLLEAITAALDD